jgi:hypothetical protein
MSAVATTLSADTNVKRIRTAGYVVLMMAAIFPLIDYAVGLWPFALGNATWRFGAIGLLTNYAVGATVSLFFLLVLAVASNDRKVLLVLGTVAALAAISLVAGSASFVLDALQVRGRVTPQALRHFEYAAAQAVVKMVGLAIANALMSRSAFKATRREVRAVPRGKVSVAPLVVGGNAELPLAGRAGTPSA